MNLYTLAAIVLIIILLILGLYVVPRWRLKRALRQVIAIFRQNNALDKKTAKTVEELGLSPRSFAERMLHTRDFKPYVLNELLKMEIVKGTEDGRLYLLEDKLMSSGIKEKISPPS